MKRVIAAIFPISILSIIIITVFSCSKAEDLVDDITVPVPFSVSTTFDTQLPLAIADTVSYVKYPAIPLSLDVSAAIKEQYPSMSVSNLKSATITQFKIQYKSSVAGMKLDVIDNAKLYVRTATSQSDQLIAVADNNTSAEILNFTTDTTVDLADFIKSDQKYLVLEIQGNKITADQLTLTVDGTFKLLIGL